MSRYFPFPPPGYEKKSRAEDADLLKKEKSKEKKHKKEKKEKEKREGKEKRDKDKSDEKHREKKDKKKDRDKKKERDKEKEKEKEKAAHALEESRPSGKIKSQNGEEVVRIRHNNIQEEKHAGKLDSSVGNKISQNTVLPKETKNSKLVPEVGRRIEDSGTAKVEKFAVAQPKRDDGVATQLARSSEILFEGNKEHIKNKTIDQGKYNGQGIRHDERFIGDSTVPSFTATANATVESGVTGIKSVEKSVERRKETNDKTRQKEGEEKRGSKHKDKDKEKEKKGRSNDKAIDKEKKKEKKAREKKEKKEKQKEEKEKEKEEEKNAVVDKTKEITKDNLIGRHSTNTNTSKLPDSNIGAAVEENLIKKRKAFEPNGVLHAIDNRSSKLLRPASHPLKENGRILEPCLASTLPPERQTVANDDILVSKERKINGIIEAHHPPASLKHKTGGQDDHPQPTAMHKKSPHPDSKYLSVVYSVPKMEELSDSDNQEWLFSSNTSQAMKPELEASEAKEMPQVWAEAMQIEPSDVYALPYVIPY